MFHLTAMTALTLGWGALRLGIQVVHDMQQHAAIEGPFRRIVDGTVELAYKRGCLDGFLVGALVVLVLMSRRKQQ